MLRRMLDLCVAQMVKFIVSYVEGRQDVSERAIPAALDARDTMAECRCCKTPLKKKGEEPRQLLRLPIEVTQDTSFKRKGLPISVCVECDGEAALLATSLHKQRVAKP
jgi:hypothetical protein